MSDLEAVVRAATVPQGVAVLAWADYGPRSGWWLRTPEGETWMVHGPSICETSGGGASRAMSVVRGMGWTEGVTALPVEHTDVDGRACECSVRANAA